MEELLGWPGEAQITAWKMSHEIGIFAVKKAGRIAFFKKPGFKEIDAYYALGKKELGVTDEWKALCGMLWLGGDRELIDSPLYLPSVAREVQKQMAGEETELVNL